MTPDGLASMHATVKAGIVTGAGSGIGAAVARRLGAAGWRLTLINIDEPALDRTASEIRTAPGHVITRSLDIADFAALESACAASVAQHGSLDLVVACAGTSTSGPFLETDPSTWEGIISTNLLGTAYTVRASLPLMHGGDIVVVASVSGREAYPGEAIYIASKWGVVGMTYAMRRELRGRTRVTLIEPGLVDTPLAHRNALAQQWLEQTRPLDANDVADSVIFALGRPAHAAVNELVLRPLDQLV